MAEDVDHERKLVQQAARRYLSERCPVATVREHLESRTIGSLVTKTWPDLADLGWPSILTEGQEQVPVMSALAEELGSALYPGPLLSSAVAADAVARSGTAELRSEYLERMSSGVSPAGMAIHPDAGGNDADQLTARWTARGVELSGTVSVVPNGPDVAVLLVAASSAAGRVLVLVPTNSTGLHVVPLESLDRTRSFARFEVTDVVVPEYAVLVTDPAANRTTEDLMTLLACAETVGAAQRAFDLTVEYAKTRIAFGRPIGAFQVIKHRLVDMLLALECVRAAVDATLAELGSESAFGQHGAAIAKLYASTKLPLLARDCLQIHGGIGFTWEHDIHLYLRRIESNALLWGNPDRLAERLAPEIGLADQQDSDPRRWR